MIWIENSLILFSCLSFTLCWGITVHHDWKGTTKHKTKKLAWCTLFIRFKRSSGRKRLTGERHQTFLRFQITCSFVHFIIKNRALLNCQTSGSSGLNFFSSVIIGSVHWFEQVDHSWRCWTHTFFMSATFMHFSWISYKVLFFLCFYRSHDVSWIAYWIESQQLDPTTIVMWQKRKDILNYSFHKIKQQHPWIF